MANTISLMLLCDAVLGRRLRLPAHRVGLVAITLLSFVFLCLMQERSQSVRIMAFLVLDLMMLLLYQGSVLSRACIAALHYIIGGALETIVLAAVFAIGNLSIVEFRQSPAMMTLVYITPVCIQFVLCFFLSKLLYRWRNHVELPLWEWLVAFLFAAFTIFELYFAGIMIQANSPMMPLLSLQGLVLLLMNVSLLLLLDKLASRYRIEKENFTLQEQMHYNRQSLQVASKAYEAQRGLTHDFDNHLLAVSHLLQGGQSEEALAYLQTVRQRVEKADVAVSTNNPIADAVLNQKYMKAQELGVSMRFLINDLSRFPLPTDEMVTVLSNLLDNALEASSRCDDKKSIRVKLLLEPALATISVQNTSAPVEISAEGEVATSKQDRSAHGFGLKNSKRILQQSGFDFAIRYEHGWFQFTAIKAM